MKFILTSIVLPLLPAPILAAVGGRCSNNWGGDCICLDSTECRDKWGGKAYTGSPGNWPCPNDADNIMACVVKPCPGVGGSSQCLWSNVCGSQNVGKICAKAITNLCH
jgi:hypothetical protein